MEIGVESSGIMTPMMTTWTPTILTMMVKDAGDPDDDVDFDGGRGGESFKHGHLTSYIINQKPRRFRGRQRLQNWIIIASFYI